MKKINYSYFFVSLVLLVSVWTACEKDKGFYDPAAIDKEFKGNTYEYLKSKVGIYDSLVQVIDRLELQSLLKDSAVTLFAVSNAGFNLAITNLNNVRKLTDKDPEYLATVDGAQLDTMLSQYIMRGVFPSDSLRGQDGLLMHAISTAYPMHARVQKATASGYIGGGPERILYSNTKRSQFERDWVGTTTGSINIRTSNGVVHVLNSDHIFGFDEFNTRLLYIPPPPNLFSKIGGTLTVSRENGGGAGGVEGSNNIVDQNAETKWFLGDFNNAWAQFELNEAAVAGAYTITSANDISDRDPKDWNLQGSTDGENWTTLDARSNEVFEQRFLTRVFYFNNTNAYKFFRLNIVRTNTNAMQFADWTVNEPKQ